MATQKWLKNYFGKEFSVLSPAVIAEGRTKAVVRLTRRATKGFSGMGYILVDKKGKNNVSDHLVLHEGVASTEDVETMKRVLAQKEGE